MEINFLDSFLPLFFSSTHSFSPLLGLDTSLGDPRYLKLTSRSLLEIFKIKSPPPDF